MGALNNTIVFILGILLGSFFFYKLYKLQKTFKIKKYLKKAKRAEVKAASILKEHGYTIKNYQKHKKIKITINGKTEERSVYADFIVKKNFKTYIVEVKTGKQTNAAAGLVRRQLLEYYIVFKVDGILLLDMENIKLNMVEFDKNYFNQNRRMYLLFFLLGIMLSSFVLITYFKI